MDATETSQNLSQFLVNNYKQALNTLAGRDDLLQRMKIHGIEGPWVFEEWLEEERTYLQGLSQELELDILKMKYYQWLMNLADCKQQAQELSRSWLMNAGIPAGPQDSIMSLDSSQKSTALSLLSQNTRLNLVLSQGKSAEAAALDLEQQLNITVHWTPSRPEW
ncbi:hypothetical protein P691DRAFT_768275 [Macrolepiota fuliginosa MF-IS2]|uniref:Uncharacterized protein n=1 Tax=Macrolepiota fuliginosa MF-IS2 TaxID=1400762 RepID=A0A9P5WY96_9AGAR|nr:hypothetical protein P691DRAFT_768275 [Macrolepiota fuliginosa MF-IS2]